MAVRPSPKKDTSSDYRKKAMHAEIAAETQRLKNFLAPTVEQQQLFLEDIEIKMAGASRTVHVIVDLPEGEAGGVSLDRISDVAHALSEAMDADPHDDGRPYSLEVSSPGVSRPLTEPRHWRRNVGRMVNVNVMTGDDVKGRLVSVEADGITLIPELPVKKGMSRASRCPCPSATSARDALKLNSRILKTYRWTASPAVMKKPQLRRPRWILI
jgi:ribosome maturation factor RimP